MCIELHSSRQADGREVGGTGGDGSGGDGKGGEGSGWEGSGGERREGKEIGGEGKDIGGEVREGEGTNFTGGNMMRELASIQYIHKPSHNAALALETLVLQIKNSEQV